MFVRPEEDRFAIGDLIRAMTVSGTAPELRDRMRRLREAGYDEVVVQITPGSESMIEDWARVFERLSEAPWLRPVKVGYWRLNQVILLHASA